MKSIVMLSNAYAECHLFWVSHTSPLCRVPLCWTSLCGVSLCWLSWRRLKLTKIIQTFQTHFQIPLLSKILKFKKKSFSSQNSLSSQCQCYIKLFAFSLILEENKLECLTLNISFSLVCLMPKPILVLHQIAPHSRGRLLLLGVRLAWKIQG